MNLSKSRYCNAIQCKKILWLDKYKHDEKEDVKNQGVLDKGIEVGELARSYFGEYINIDKEDDLSIMIEKTDELIKNNDNIIITEASFNYNNNFCSVDILIKNGDTFDIYEVKSSTEIKDIYIDDISYQYYVLNNLGLNINSINLMYINRNYERGDYLELDKLFIIEDLTNIASMNLSEVDNKIKDINEYMEQTSEPDDDIGMHCFKPYDCPFFKYCTKKLGENNVFDLRRIRKDKMFKLYYSGKYSFLDLIDEDIDWKALEQIDYELHDLKDKIDSIAIKEFLNTLSYPLYFLDFETFQDVIPKYKGIRPYDQIPFQYSLHYIESEGDILKHKEFLAEDSIDPRRLLAESLVRDIPINVYTLAYNMGFEKGVIKKLSETYPDLSDHLMNIHDNIKDLMIPFSKRYYYNKNMMGSYSIKYVLPALFPSDPTLDYHNLEDIHNGGEAMSEFARLHTYNKEDKERIRHNLLKYCELDTYAMVKIWQKLKEIEEINSINN